MKLKDFEKIFQEKAKNQRQNRDRPLFPAPKLLNFFKNQIAINYKYVTFFTKSPKLERYVNLRLKHSVLCQLNRRACRRGAYPGRERHRGSLTRPQIATLRLFWSKGIHTLMWSSRNASAWLFGALVSSGRPAAWVVVVCTFDLSEYFVKFFRA